MFWLSRSYGGCWINLGDFSSSSLGWLDIGWLRGEEPWFDGAARLLPAAPRCYWKCDQAAVDAVCRKGSSWSTANSATVIGRRFLKSLLVPPISLELLSLPCAPSKSYYLCEAYRLCGSGLPIVVLAAGCYSDM